MSSNLSDFLPFTGEEIDAASVARQKFRSSEVCICGHSEGSHTGRRLGLVGPREDCHIGRVQCECNKYVGVLKASSVLPFRCQTGHSGNGHPLSQGIRRLTEKGGSVEKLDGWKCAISGCGSTGSLIPTYFEGFGGDLQPSVRHQDTGTTFLLCPLHVNGPDGS